MPCTLEKHEDEIVKIYSRASWIDERKKPARYFCSLFQEHSDVSFLLPFILRGYKIFNHEDLHWSLLLKIVY